MGPGPACRSKRAGAFATFARRVSSSNERRKSPSIRRPTKATSIAASRSRWMSVTSAARATGIRVRRPSLRKQSAGNTISCLDHRREPGGTRQHLRAVSGDGAVCPEGYRMICSGCGAIVAQGKKFCGDCGSPLAWRCSACGSENPPGKRFCGDCGAPFGATSTDMPQVAPPPSTAPVAERRQLTVMFADLVGSTGLSARLDPEDLREVIARYHGCVTGLVAHFGGFVARYLGDGVLVYFGFPQAHEDDPERSVRAGLAVIEAVRALDTVAGPAGTLNARV